MSVFLIESTVLYHLGYECGQMSCIIVEWVGCSSALGLVTIVE